jgi:hypothetical protein
VNEKKGEAIAPLFFYGGLFFFLDLRDKLFDGFGLIPQNLQMLLKIGDPLFPAHKSRPIAPGALTSTKTDVLMSAPM